MSHGIIPFGAVHQWQHDADRWLAAALAAPLVGRVVGWGTTGVGLAVVCPWCRGEHRHVITEPLHPTEDWEPGTVLQASCGKGVYRVVLPGS